jgi:phosphoesterase RecJ-like protein
MDRSLLEDAGRRLESWPRTMILSHRRPDGDALGAMAAMARNINAAGREAMAFVYNQIPPRYEFLKEWCEFAEWPSGAVSELNSRFDGILVLDTCSWSQLEPAAGFLRGSGLHRIVVDHHQTRDDISGERGQAMYVIDPSASSACSMLWEWCEVMGCRVDEIAASALFTGMATDTGWFRFSNTDATTLRGAAALRERGARPDVLYGRLYGSQSAARLRLMGEMLNTLRFEADGSLAIAVLTPEMFERTGADRADTEDLVNEPMTVGPVIVSILLTDLGTGEIRASFRSKSPEVCGRDVDVAALAARFGGGGHRRAAGARVKDTLEAAREQIMGAALEVLGG